MAAINWDSNFNVQQKYLTQLIKQDTQKGNDSPIRPFLAQHNIVLADLSTDAAQSGKYDAERLDLEGKAKQGHDKRDDLFKPVWTKSQKMLQSLKKFYDENQVAFVQDWGVETTVNGKLLYPKDFTGKTLVVQRLLAKHASYTDPAKPSPLSTYIAVNKIDVKAMATDLDAAKKADADASGYEDLAMNKTTLRNKAWDPVFEKIKSIGQFLSSIYPDDPTEVGLWGIPIVLNPTAKESSESTVPPGTTVIKKALKIGYVLKNTGETDLYIQSGGKKKSEVKTVKPTEEMLIAKGFSRLQVENKDPLQKGIFIVYKK